MKGSFRIETKCVTPTLLREERPSISVKIPHQPNLPLGRVLHTLPDQVAPFSPFPGDWDCGGFVEGQRRIAKEQLRSFAGPSPKIDGKNRFSTLANPEENQRPAQDSGTEPTAPEVLAHAVEFVTLPGRSKELRRTIPETLCSVLGNSGGFLGCMVFVSEQEARLMTVITLWAGRDAAEQCDNNLSRVNQLLLPHVDTWLRSQRMTAFLCWQNSSQSSAQNSRTARASQLIGTVGKEIQLTQ
jgi:hypothetical protein